MSGGAPESIGDASLLYLQGNAHDLRVVATLTLDVDAHGTSFARRREWCNFRYFFKCKIIYYVKLKWKKEINKTTFS